MFKTVLHDSSSRALHYIGNAERNDHPLDFPEQQLSRSMCDTLFWFLHPAHVFLSALVTTAMYRRHARGNILMTLAIGYFGDPSASAP